MGDHSEYGVGGGESDDAVISGVGKTKGLGSISGPSTSMGELGGVSQLLVNGVMVSPLFVCECPLALHFLRNVRSHAFLPGKLFFGIAGGSGTSKGIGVRLRGTSMSPFAKGSCSSVKTRSTAIASVCESTLVRRLDATPWNELECGVGGIDPAPEEENVVKVSNED